jgi:chromatin structure-remodeling complex protein RSC7
LCDKFLIANYTFFFTDGKWVEDDYYEEKSLEEITARGLKAGDPVGELPDPSSHTSETAALAATTKAGLLAQSKADKGGALGIYRAGGPTTLFGGPGWGPYSDGPLNAVRKSLLNRDGLNEENWMFVAAQRTVEAAGEWAKIRKEALKACGGIMMGGRSGKEVEEGVVGEEPVGSNKDSAEAIAGVPKKKRKALNDMDDLPLGVYEPHGGIVHCMPIPFSIVSHILI